MARDLLPYAVLLALLLLGGYVYFLALRSRESELRRALRKCEIALQDAERTLRATEAAAFPPAPGNGPETGGGDAKFRRAKSAFARLFHPDAAGGDAAERRIRSEIFKQFWDELERIENSRRP